MKNKTISKLRTAAVVFTNFLVMLALMYVWQPVHSSEAVVNELKEAVPVYIYIHNRSDGKPDTVIITDEEMIEYVCGIEGISDVTIDGVDIVCDTE